MRIPCPYCGERDAQEFVYRGDASLKRPEGDAGYYDYVYLRGNPDGQIQEHWYHASGCRNWLVVIRDTRSHEIFGAVLAKDVAR